MDLNDNDNHFIDLVFNMGNSAQSSTSQLVQHYDELVDYISMKIGNRQIALEVVQETYMRVFQRPEQFMNLINPVAFLKTVSANIAFDYLRKDKNYGKYFEVVEAEELELYSTMQDISEQELSLAREQYAKIILGTISTLPPACQDVFLLLQFYGMTQVETAQQLGISRTMVIKHFTRALQSFVPIFADE